jgi:hypothetical protein
MGILTDFVVASAKDAKRVGMSSSPSQDFNGLDAKGIDTVKLGKLHAILTGEAFDPSFMTGDALLFAASEEGPWVFEVPPDFVKRLAVLKDKELKSVATEWAKCEEFSPNYGNWLAASVKQILTELVELCKQAASERNSVLMWMCL